MEEYHTVNEAAAILKVHPLTIRRYINQSKLKAYRVGGSVRIAANDLRAFMQSFVTAQVSSTALSPPAGKPFTPTDSIFGLKGKGRSLTRFES